MISGWWKAQQQLRDLKRQGGGGLNLLTALGQEVEMWARRTAALRSGALAVYRIHGERKP